MPGFEPAPGGGGAPPPAWPQAPALHVDTAGTQQNGAYAQPLAYAEGADLVQRPLPSPADQAHSLMIPAPMVRWEGLQCAC